MMGAGLALKGVDRWQRRGGMCNGGDEGTSGAGSVDNNNSNSDNNTARSTARQNDAASQLLPRICRRI
ncbi:MAG TPA: hypothetical protein VHI13_18170 [Candidatus Kapabacteria bacterium]|nr:hypothetical protein [Candidatus Kapabacteria bacterium]